MEFISASFLPSFLLVSSSRTVPVQFLVTVSSWASENVSTRPHMNLTLPSGLYVAPSIYLWSVRTCPPGLECEAQHAAYRPESKALIY